MLGQIYSQWIERWENKLCFRSTDRVVRPFEWGLDWAGNWPTSNGAHRNGHDEIAWLRELNQRAIAQSGDFYGYTPPTDFRLDDGMVRFTTAAPTPHRKNNTVHAQWFPAEEKPGRPRRAVIVLPHWNAHAGQHAGLCKGLARFGLSALRLSLPYHDHRMPEELHRADYAVSSNIARTIDATRQAVIDTRSAADWLELQGYERIGIVGTSLGSCYAFLTSAHDPRLRVNVFNHCSSHFGDVVWTGLSTRHIRQSIEGNLDRDSLRDVWQAISPVSYMQRFAGHSKRSLFVYTRYDTTFLPEFSREILAFVARHGIDHRVVVLPCGHYTLGETPFKFIDGYHIVSFFLRNL
ncbi:MAG: abhydrolase domain-containing 18 [Acidobacteria bacterium]|nr:abhydrolase domain-containing 18 [Acidobacteriota bacterium]